MLRYISAHLLLITPLKMFSEHIHHLKVFTGPLWIKVCFHLFITPVAFPGFNPNLLLSNNFIIKFVVSDDTKFLSKIWWRYFHCTNNSSGCLISKEKFTILRYYLALNHFKLLTTNYFLFAHRVFGGLSTFKGTRKICSLLIVNCWKLQWEWCSY